MKLSNEVTMGIRGVWSGDIVFDVHADKENRGAALGGSPVRLYQNISVNDAKAIRKALKKAIKEAEGK